jgi:hypothetical protein
VGITAPQKWVDGCVSCLASFQWEGPEEAE